MRPVLVVIRFKLGRYLRVLDSKDRRDIEVFQTSSTELPRLDEYLTDASRRFHERVQAGLDALGIPYILNPRLVRGLDYYGDTAFEFVANDDNGDGDGRSDELGAQQRTVLGGGRYDGLSKVLGGPRLPAIGWAAGLERLVLLRHSVNVDRSGDRALPDVAVLPLLEKRSPSLSPLEGNRAPSVEMEALRIAQRLRRHGFCTIQGQAQTRASSLFRWAHKSNAKLGILIGERELQEGQLTLKNMNTSEQISVPFKDLESNIASMLNTQS